MTESPVNPTVDNAKLSRAKHLIGEDLISLADLRLPPLLLLLVGLHCADGLLLVDCGHSGLLLLACAGAGLHHRHDGVLDGCLPLHRRLLPAHLASLEIQIDLPSLSAVIHLCIGGVFSYKEHHCRCLDLKKVNLVLRQSFG